MSAFENTKGYELGKVLSHETHSHTYEATVKGGGVGTAAGGAGSGAGSGSGSGKSFRVRRIFGAAADRMKVDRAAAVVEQLAALTHPGLLPVIESYVLNNEDSGGRDLCVVYENLTGSSLAHKLGENSFKKDVTAGMPALELADVTELFFNIVEALKYLHSNNVAHMDIRPESVIYRGSTGSTVLMNYGMIDIVAVNAMELIAPEIHKRESLLPEALLKADIWALGALMLYVTCGKHIVTRLQDSWQEDLAVLISAYESCHSKDKFTHQTWSVQQVLDTHFQEYPQAEALWKRIPQELSAIILLCLSVDPSARPSIHELLETPQYKALQCARNSDYSGAPKSKMNDDERELLRSHIDDLTMRLATREERMICLETLLATERDAHYRTSQLLEESNDKLEEALEKIKLLEVDDDEDNAKAQEPPIPTVVGLHHPGFYNGELNEWMCCTKKGRLPPGCQEGDIMHHPGYYDPYGGGRWGCCSGGWNSHGCTPGEQPKWER